MLRGSCYLGFSSKKISYLNESLMTYKVQTTVRNPWAFWSVLTILWFTLIVVAWPNVNWFIRVVLIIFLLVPLFGVLSSLKPVLCELVVDDGNISWGNQLNEIIDIGKIRRIVLDEDKDMIFLNWKTNVFLQSCPGCLTVESCVTISSKNILK